MASPTVRDAKAFQPTVRDVMAFHKVDRLVYEKLVMHGIHLGLARDVVCLLIWLDQMKAVDLSRTILSIESPTIIAAIVAEGELILHYIQQDNNASTFIEFPYLSKLLNRRIDTNFFGANKAKLMKSINDKINGVGRVIFEDYLYEILHAYEKIAEQETRWGRPAPEIPAKLKTPYHHTLQLALPADDQSIFINPLAEGFMDYFA